MTINTPQPKEPVLARESENAVSSPPHIEIRPLNLAEWMQVAGGPTIINDNM